MFIRHHKALDVDRAYPILLLMPLPKLLINLNYFCREDKKKCHVDFGSEKILDTNSKKILGTYVKHIRHIRYVKRN